MGPARLMRDHFPPWKRVGRAGLFRPGSLSQRQQKVALSDGERTAPALHVSLISWPRSRPSAPTSPTGELINATLIGARLTRTPSERSPQNPCRHAKVDVVGSSPISRST